MNRNTLYEQVVSILDLGGTTEDTATALVTLFGDWGYQLLGSKRQVDAANKKHTLTQEEQGYNEAITEIRIRIKESTILGSRPKASHPWRNGR